MINTNVPQTLSEFIGQDRVRENLGIAIEAAKKRNEPLDHILLCGQEGLGNTTMARIIANEMNAEMRFVSCKEVKNDSEMVTMLIGVNAGDIIFLNYLEMLTQSASDALIEVMTSFSKQTFIGKEMKCMMLDFPHFTIISEVESTLSLTRELQSCFGIIECFEPYSKDEIKMMIQRWGTQLQVSVNDNAALELASNCNGMPSTARRMLKRTRDYAEVLNNRIVSREIVDKVVAQERDLW